MQPFLSILSAGRDAAQRWLAENRVSDGCTDISNGDWDSSLEIIHGIEFDKIRLTGRVVYPNFVNCGFRSSEFFKLTTDGHFWGAGNEWEDCSFSNSLLQSVISPQNAFVGCTFTDVVFEGYHACETLFDTCRFLNCRFESLRTTPKRRARWAILRMAKLGSSLQFVECKFEQAEFLHCDFAETAFSNSTFVEPVATDCDFTGINADLQWWPDSAQSDVFVCYLDHMLVEISKRLGPDSRAAQSLALYRVSYARGDTTSKDFSACWYDGSVSDEELDAVDDIVERTSDRFGM